MKNKILSLLIVAAFALCGCLPVAASAAAETDPEEPLTPLFYESTEVLTVPDVFQSKMMFQQKKPFTVWGSAPAGDNVTITLKKGSVAVQTKTATASSGYAWEAEFDGIDASFDEYALVITDGNKTVKINRILFGELYLASGQSNMGFNVQYASDAAQILAEAVNPNIRFFDSGEMGSAANYPYKPSYANAVSGLWSAGNEKDAVGATSAVAYAFAKETYAYLNKNAEAHVPVGFLNVSKGSTSIWAWFDRATAKNNEHFKAYGETKGLFAEEADYNKRGAQNFNQLSAMYNSRVAPVSKMKIRGIVWYQGENNVGDESAGALYATALDMLVKDYSKRFNNGVELPLVFAQLTPHNYKYEPTALPFMWEGMNTAWAMSEDNRAQIPTYDIPHDWFNLDFAYRSPIHPMIKTPIGKRLSRAMQSLVYGEEEYLAPTYAGSTADGRKLKVKFNHTGGALKTTGGTAQNFTVCGEDLVHYPARAEITGLDEITLTSDFVANPVAATYCFSTMPEGVFLLGGNGLPVVPFRTNKSKSQLYYFPKYWQSFDALEHFESDGSGKDSEIAGMRQMYGSSANATPAIEKGTENGALKLEYELFGKADVTVAPKLSVPAVANDSTTHEQFGDYDVLRIKVKNPDGREKTFKGVYATIATGESGYLPLSGGTETQVTLPAFMADFQTFTFDLTKLSGDGIIDITNKKMMITELRFDFSDRKAGSILLDDASLGRAAALKADEPQNPEGGPDNNEESGCGSSADASGVGITCVLLAAAGLLVKKSRVK